MEIRPFFSPELKDSSERLYTHIARNVFDTLILIFAKGVLFSVLMMLEIGNYCVECSFRFAIAKVLRFSAL